MLRSIQRLTASSTNSLMWLFIGIVICWLFWSAAIVGIETGDGYLSITTSQYFLGLNKIYGFQRGPLLPIYLIPAEWISNTLNLHPLDVRIHHVFTALLHSLYIICTWLLIRQYYRDFDWLVAIAFLATIPSFIFFSYAIFISADIIPGLILAYMIFLVVKYEKKQHWTTWIILVLLGFIAVIIKQTYALFWVSIIITCWIYYSGKINTHLFVAAVFSGLLSYLFYAWFLLDALPPDALWWMGPIQQILYINQSYDSQKTEINDVFVWWLYIRNYYNYGILTATLIVPAIIYSLFYIKKTDDKTLQIMAVTWLLCFAFMQLISFKEVRYVAYLAPLSAFLLVPFLRQIYTSKHRLAFIILLTFSLLFDFSQNISEALRINKPFYTDMVINYFRPLDDAISNKTELDRSLKTLMINPVSFTPHIFSPLKGDRYHRTFHISTNNVRDFYGFNNTNFTAFNTGVDKFNISYEMLSAGDVLLFSNANPVREPPWDKFNMATLDKNYTQAIGIAEDITLSRNNNQFDLISNSGDSRPLLILNNRFQIFGVILGYKAFKLNALSELLGKSIIQQDTIQLTGIRVNRLCTINGCFNMNNKGQSMQ